MWRLYVYLYEKYRDLLEKYIILRSGVIFINRKSYEDLNYMIFRCYIIEYFVKDNLLSNLF